MLKRGKSVGSGQTQWPCTKDKEVLTASLTSSTTLDKLKTVCTRYLKTKFLILVTYGSTLQSTNFPDHEYLHFAGNTFVFSSWAHCYFSFGRSPTLASPRCFIPVRFSLYLGALHCFLVILTRCHLCLNGGQQPGNAPLQNQKKIVNSQPTQ